MADNAPALPHINPQQYPDTQSPETTQDFVTLGPSSIEPPELLPTVSSVPSPASNSSSHFPMTFAWPPKAWFRRKGKVTSPSLPSPDPTQARRHSQPSPPASPATFPGACVVDDPPQGPTHRRTKSSLVQRVSEKLRRRHEPEERSGPVLMRLRTDSVNDKKAGRLGIQKVHSLDDGGPLESGGNNAESENGAGNVDLEAARQEAPSELIIPPVLQQGTAMTRVTRTKKIQRVFTLDAKAARVTWDPTKQTSRFYIDDIREIRLRENARNYREEFQISSEVEERWATIIYAGPEGDGKLKTLHIIAPTAELFTLWTTTLESILRYRTEMMAGLAMQGERFVDAHWRNYMESQCRSKAKVSKEERLNFGDVERLCRRLHVNCSKQFLKDRFEESDQDKSGYLTFAEFREFVRLLKQRDEIVDIWKEAVVDKKAGMSIDEFQSFLGSSQKVDIDSDQAHIAKIFNKFSRPPSATQKTDDQPEELRMTMDSFSDFLLSSSYNPPLRTSPAPLDLDRPLNEYYISSSHNTYLLGRQVAGESSIEGYVRVLKRGCRCVEIDCWDGVDGRPIVTHGHTGTSSVLFADVISAIGKYSFVASPLPVILSLEVHCSLEQQTQMARILVRVLGDTLVTDPFMTNTLVLPSPSELMNRILVKVKGSSKKDSFLRYNDVIATEKHSGGAGNSRESGTRYTNSSKGTIPIETSSSTSESEGHDEDSRPKKESVKIAPELGALGVYTRGQRFSNFALPESKTCNHVFSFQEKKFEKFLRDPEKRVQLEKHNVRYLMRAYPSGLRVGSSNFDPIGFWRRGVQMVALNWQTYDLGLQINDAMFASDDGHGGYVLKPQGLRGPRTTFDPPADASATVLKKDMKTTKFSVEIISAQQLPKPKDHKADKGVNPFIVVEVFSADDKAREESTAEGGTEIDSSDSRGVSGLGAPQRRRTRVVKDDGFHPLFNEKMVFTITTKFEELVFVRFSVYNADDGGSNGRTVPIATYTAKLIFLQQGYRHLPLYDLQGDQFLFSTIFVNISVNPMSAADREPFLSLPTIGAITSTARSVLSNFSSENSVRRPKHKKPARDGQEPARQN